MGDEDHCKRKRELWQDEEYRAGQLATRREVHGGAEHVAGRRAVFQAKRLKAMEGMEEPDRVVHAEYARRDAVQGARKTIKKGTMTSDRDPMKEVVEVYGDGSEYKTYKALFPEETRGAMEKFWRARGYSYPAMKKLTAETIG